MLERQEQEQERVENDEVVIDEQEPDAVVDAEQLSGADDDDGDDDSIVDEVVVSIGDEPLPEERPAPRWVKELRKSQRELQRENRELKAKLDSSARTESKPVQPGSKPTLDGCDYDSERFEAELAAWFDRKKEADQVEMQARAAQEAQEREWGEKLYAYQKAKVDLRVRDYDDAEDTVQQFLSVTQQGVLLEGADSPALLVYALGKNPSKAKELAAITSPVKFAFAVARLEKDLKVSNRAKKAPTPENIVSGTARISGATDAHLDRLREKAAKTNDYSEVNAYKKQLRDKQKR
jgi:hypothetical protein